MPAPTRGQVDIDTLVVTGGTGFLGGAIRDAAVSLGRLRVVALPSARAGGPDLTARDADERLGKLLALRHPERTALVHAAAVVRWNDVDGLIGNAAMAANVARFAASAGIGHSVLVSGVNVYAAAARADVDTPCRPASLYGVGKVAAEHVWAALIHEERRAVVRLAGLWGWQRTPTLFWNRLMLAAAGAWPGGPLVVRRLHSRRNYISVHAAADGLLQIAVGRQTGMFLGAGVETADTGTLLVALRRLCGREAFAIVEDDGGVDEFTYVSTEPFLGLARPLQEEVNALWKRRPVWVA